MPVPHKPCPRRTPPGSMACLVLLGLLAAVPAVAQMSASQPAELPPPDQAERTRYVGLLQKKLLLERETGLKSLQLQLAEDDAPYLVLDLEDRQVRVYVRVTPVRTLALERAEMEVLAGVSGEQTEAAAWLDRQLDLVAKSGDDMAPEILEAPAAPRADDAEFNPRAVTPELAGLEDPEYPSRYTLLYRQGIAVNVVGGGQPVPEGSAWLQKRIERLSALLVRPELPAAEEMEPVHTWVHLTLPAEDAQALYPIAFTGMRAMIRLPGDPRF